MNPRSSTHAAAKHLTLPAEYLMIHRVALGMVGLLCQLEATVPLRDLEIRWSPGFRITMAEDMGVDPQALLTESVAHLTARYGAFTSPQTLAHRKRRSNKKVAAIA